MFKGHQLSEAVLNLDSDLSLACTGNETMTQTEFIEYRRSNLCVALYNYEKCHLQNENREPPSAQTIHGYEERLSAMKDHFVYWQQEHPYVASSWYFDDIMRLSENPSHHDIQFHIIVFLNTTSIHSQDK